MQSDVDFQTVQEGNPLVSSALDWERIESFIGFGCLQAPVLFIGMEEGLRSPDALLEDLAIRSTYEPVMDLKEAHRGIKGNERYFDPEHAPRQPSA